MHALYFVSSVKFNVDYLHTSNCRIFELLFVCK